MFKSPLIPFKPHRTKRRVLATVSARARARSKKSRKELLSCEGSSQKQRSHDQQKRRASIALRSDTPNIVVRVVFKAGKASAFGPVMRVTSHLFKCEGEQNKKDRIGAREECLAAFDPGDFRAHQCVAVFEILPAILRPYCQLPVVIGQSLEVLLSRALGCRIKSPRPSESAVKVILRDFKIGVLCPEESYGIQ